MMGETKILAKRINLKVFKKIYTISSILYEHLKKLQVIISLLFHKLYQL